MVRNSLGRLFQYFGAATVKVASTYIDDTNGTESFISSHLRLEREVARIMTPFDMYSGIPICIYSLVSNAKKTTLSYISKLKPPESRHCGMDIYGYISTLKLK